MDSNPAIIKISQVISAALCRVLHIAFVFVVCDVINCENETGWSKEHILVLFVDQ